MEQGTSESEANLAGSLTRTGSVGSSLRRRSLSSLRIVPLQLVDDIESENVSEAGDIGDRALHSNRHSESGSIRFSFDNTIESGAVFPVAEDSLLQSNSFWSHGAAASSTRSPVSPLAEEIVFSLSTDAANCSEGNKDKQKVLVLPTLWDYVSSLVFLAFFGILGVLTRYLLQKLFGPSIAGVTSDHYPLYLDLPSNMVGSFLMGWWGVVFKGDISYVSNYLAIGLTTGYLGSLTTFSGWNQKMLDLSVDGHWVFSAVGFLLGLFLAAYSIKFGVGTAKCFKLFLERNNWSATNSCWRIDNRHHHMAAVLMLVLMLGLLWSLSGTLLKEEFNKNSDRAELWLACLVAAPGVWIRWFLARLNGRGIGKGRYLIWVPFGTLIANVSAACIMAALATLKKAVNTQTCDTISTGVQLGFLGCLSTVSTFIAEYNAMEESQKTWKAYVYALVTIIVSFGMGILIYGVPVWVKGYA